MLNGPELEPTEVIRCSRNWSAPRIQQVRGCSRLAADRWAAAILHPECGNLLRLTTDQSSPTQTKPTCYITCGQPSKHKERAT